MNLTNIAVKNLMRRKAKAMFIMAGLVTGVATMVAVIGFIDAMTDRINHKMERYGANILIMPKTDNLSLSYGGLSLGGVSFDIEQLRNTDLEKLGTIKNAANIAAVGPVVLDVFDVSGQKVLLAGVDFSSTRILKPWWRLNGAEPGTSGVILGSETSSVLGLGPGETIVINGRSLKVTGILEPTGSQDDHLVFAGLKTAQSLMNKDNRISMAEVAALCGACPIEEMVRQIGQAIPSAKVMAISQVVKGRMDTLSRFRTFSFGMSVIIIIVGSLVVLVTMMSSVRERTEEIGIFRAIGFRKSHIMRIIFSEAAIISGPSGLIGYGAGSLVAMTVLRFFTPVKDATLAFDPILFFAAIILSIMVGMGASIYPAFMAARLDPNLALRSI